jgi:AICAR transformylase/IMP cyclohydrolase PurH
MMLQRQLNKQIVLRVVIAPEYDAGAIVTEKKNRIILIQNEVDLPQKTSKILFKRTFNSRKK